MAAAAGWLAAARLHGAARRGADRRAGDQVARVLVVQLVAGGRAQVLWFVGRG